MTDGKKLVQVTMKIWNGSGYGPDWANEFFETAGLEFDGEVDAFMVDDVDYCIEQMEDWKNCTNDYIDDEDPDGNRYVDAVVLLEEDSAELTAYRIRHNGEWNPDDCRRVDVDIISDSSHEKPYDEFTARAQQVKSDALATDEAASLFDGGWRSSDYYQLMFERRCDKEEAAGICAALATFEQ